MARDHEVVWVVVNGAGSVVAAAVHAKGTAHLKQGDKQTDIQPAKPPADQPARQTEKQANRQTGRQKGR